MKTSLVNTSIQHQDQRRGGVKINEDIGDLDVLGGGCDESDNIVVMNGFVQEKLGYNPYCCYQERKILAWNEWPKFIGEHGDKYLAAEKRQPKEVISKLESILDGNLDTIEEGTGFCYKIPDRKKRNLEYIPSLAIYLLRKGQEFCKSRNFCNLGQRLSATRTVSVIRQIITALTSGFHISKRFIYYGDKYLFVTQETSDKVIDDICCLVETDMDSLGIIPATTGLVLGDIVLQMVNGCKLDCSFGLQIPTDIKMIDRIQVGHRILGHKRYIVVVEKHSLYNFLQQRNYQDLENCIIVTGCGMPSLSVRRFLRFLKEKTGLAVYGVCDPDPCGAEIMAVYAMGSVNTSYNNINVAVPSIRWVGISTSDLDEISIPLDEKSFENFNKSDKSALKHLLDMSENLSEQWLNRIRHMEQKKKKLSFEVLGHHFIDILPDLIVKADEATVVWSEAEAA